MTTELDLLKSKLDYCEIALIMMVKQYCFCNNGYYEQSYGIFLLQRIN